MNKKSIIICLLAFLFIGNLLPAQSVPTPAKKAELPIILRNGIIHTGTGEVISDGDILINEGKLVEVGTVTQSFKRATIIDLQRRHVYPGIIAPNTQLGLGEIGAVRATRDMLETGSIKPNIRTLTGYNTDSRVIPTVRSNGILLAQIVPQGGRIAGQSSIVQLDAWNWEDAAYKIDEGMHIYWPRMNYRPGQNVEAVEKQKKKIKSDVAEIYTAFDAAIAYKTSKDAGKIEESDLRWEAMIPLLEKKQKVYVHAQFESQLASAIALKDKYNLDLVIVGGRESHLFAAILKEKSIPVILQKTHNLPPRQDEDLDLPFKLPAILHKAGVKFCLSGEGYWDQRNLPFQAGTAAAYGLSKEEALQSITLNSAQILGIDDVTGSIEVGKDANIIISKGDLLDMRSSIVEIAFIQGRQIDLGNKQKDLYEKFKAKYEAE